MLQKVIGEPEFRVRCLGGLGLTELRSGTDMTPAKRKPRALLAYLCIERKPVGRERLASLLWGDRGDEQARASLRQTLYELRSPLGGDRLLRTEGDSIAVGEHVTTDIDAITTAAQSGDLEQLRRALSEWRGEILEDLSSIDATFDSWLETTRLHVREVLVDAAVQAVKAGMARGEIEAARSIVKLLQEHDGTNEIVLRLGLMLDHLAGDSAALHRRYERFRKLLKSELDATPSIETQRLFHELEAKASTPIAAIESRSYKDAADSTALAKDGECDAAPSASLARSPAGCVSGIARPPARRVSRLGVGIAAFVVALLAALIWALWPPHKPVSPRPEPLLAVLPFQNLSADAESRYFSDGITEEIVDAVLRTTQIRVAAAQSSFSFRSSTAALATKALAATHLLSGSIRRDGDRVRVMAQLTDARNNRVLWSGAFDRRMAEIPALQHDIAIEIANALEMRLSPGSLREAGQVNPEAYDHYLKGRDLFLQRNVDAAAAELEVSARLAPGFAKVWSTLAAADALRSIFARNGQRQDPVLAKEASAAARRALTLDPDDAEALGVSALLTSSAQLRDAGRLFERAIRLEPNDTQLLLWHSRFLQSIGRFSDAVDEVKRAYELNRITPTLASNLARDLMETGQFERAKEILDARWNPAPQSVLVEAEFEQNMDYFLFRSDWSGLAAYLNALPESLSRDDAAFYRLCRETAVALAAHDTDRYPALRATWRKEGAEVVYLDSDYIVQFLFALEDADGALDFLESTMSSQRNNDFAAHPDWDTLFAPNLAGLRRNPRVPALLAQWGLFDYWLSTNAWPDFCEEPTLPFNCKAEALKYARPTSAGAVAKLP